MNEVRQLVDKLNKYRDEYYNNSRMLISDKAYDDLFDKLAALEKKTGIIYSDSPTQSVGYEVQSKLAKVENNPAMLSLDKTKEVSDVLTFCKDQTCMVSLKMDGLSCRIIYKDGNLFRASTRGNGSVGEDITANIKQVGNVPYKINKSGEYIIDGEIIIDYKSFDKVNSGLDEDNKYSHPRNLASGSIRQLDTKVTKERNLSFIAWKVISGMDKEIATRSQALFEAVDLGFEVVPFKTFYHPSQRLIVEFGQLLKAEADNLGYPIDGLVYTYDNIFYAENLGNTSHHPKHSLAFKFYNEEYETKLLDIIWQPSRTGQLNPVAVFEEVDLDGALTSRASLSNVSVMRQTLGDNPYVGQPIWVIRANQVIPKIVRAEIKLSRK